MTHRTIALMLGSLAWARVGDATTVAPFYYQCRLVDRVFEAIRGTAPVSLDALAILESVAAGRMDGASPELETRVGLKAGELRGPDFKNPTVRAHALRKIGEAGLPEALAYLQDLRREDLGSDPSQMVWPAAQIALRAAQLRRITDPYMKTEFLERTVTERHDAVSNSAVTSWAVNELCDRGAQMSLSVIQQSIRSGQSGERGENEIEFCEERIRVVLSNPDRIKALASVLSAAGGTADRNLVGWAVSQLSSMRSPSADAELDRFALEIERLPEGSPRKLSLGTYRQEILDFQQERAK
jgi:hypothetical protein